MEPIGEKYGNLPVAQLRREEIKKGFEARADTRGMANMFVKVLRTLFKYAIKEGYRTDNPANNITLWKLGEHRAWTDEECAKFEARWPTGTMQRRAYALALFTGQRCGDIARITRAHRSDGEIRVVQQKTGTEVRIAEHRSLQIELGTMGPHMSLLVNDRGAGFTSDELSKWFADAIDQAGLPSECKMHGLRKTAANTLAEVGCTAHEIMAVTGHKSLKEVERYTQAAAQKHLAKSAVHKLEQNANRTASAKRTPGRSANQEPRG